MHLLYKLFVIYRYLSFSITCNLFVCLLLQSFFFLMLQKSSLLYSAVDMVVSVMGYDVRQYW